MSLQSTLKKARKMLKEKQSKLSSNKNQYIVTKGFNREPEGALVIVLKEPTDCEPTEDLT